MRKVYSRCFINSSVVTPEIKPSQSRGKTEPEGKIDHDISKVILLKSGTTDFRGLY